MRKLYCEEHEVDANHKVLVIDMIDTFECYLMEHYEGETPYEFMFGLPADQQPFDEAVRLAIVNAPEYYDLFEEEE